MCQFFTLIIIKYRYWPSSGAIDITDSSNSVLEHFEISVISFIATEYIYIVAKMGQPDANLLTLKGNKSVDFSKKTQETWRFKQAFSSASIY